MPFPNPRLHTIPSERMRAHCVLACRFVSDDCLTDNGIVVSGSPVVSRGVTINTGDTVTATCLPFLSADKISLFYSFSCDSTASTDSISLYSDGDVEVFITLQSGVISAYHSDGTASDTLAITGTFADEETHNVLYVVDLASGVHSLYFDDDSETGATTISSDINNSDVVFSGDIEHTVYRALGFNDVLDADDFSVLSDSEWLSFIKADRYALFRCDSFSDDTIGNYVRDSNKDKKITKGDGSTTTTFPTFGGDNGDTFYSLDSSDYLSLFPAMPTAYTISMCSSTTRFDGRFPLVEQADSDDTMLDGLKTAGTFSYDNLHSIYVSDRELLALEKLQLKTKQMKDYWRSSGRGIVHELITEGVCNAALLFNCATLNRDIAVSSRYYTPNNINSDATLNTVEFLGANSNVTLAHSSNDLDFRAITIIAYGELSYVAAVRGIASKGATIEFSIGAGDVVFNGSTVTDARFSTDAEMIAVSAIDGYKPRFFKDEIFIGEGDANVSLPSANTDDFVFGNLSALTSGFTDAQTKSFLVFNVALTDREIESVFYSLRKSFEYVEPAYVVDTWQDTTTSTEIKQDTTTSTTIINDRA